MRLSRPCTAMADEQSSAAHIAVIEDDDLERGALGRLLQAGGFEPDLFDGAETFIAARPTRRWLCLVVDVQLGGMSGLELQRLLRAEGSTLPIIMTTANTSKAIRERAERAGCVAFLWKPFSGEALLALVESIAGQALP
jgi:FixJ family two-component response regulator